jgi:hypothetical protein
LAGQPPLLWKAQPAVGRISILLVHEAQARRERASALLGRCFFYPPIRLIWPSRSKMIDEFLEMIDEPFCR